MPTRRTVATTLAAIEAAGGLDAFAEAQGGIRMGCTVDGGVAYVELADDPSAGGGGGNMVSIADFDAPMNGEDDDTAALQAAIATLSQGGTIWLPPGDYRLNATIARNNIHIVGSGAFSNSSGTSRIRPYDPNEPAFTFGNGTTQYYGFGLRKLQFSSDNSQRGVLVKGCRNVAIEGCSFNGFLEYGLKLLGVDAVRDVSNVNIMFSDFYGPLTGNANCVVLRAEENSFVTVVHVIGGESRSPGAGTGHCWRFDAHPTGTTLDAVFVSHWIQVTGGRGIYMEPRGRIFMCGGRLEDPAGGVILKINDTAKIPNLWLTGSAYMMGKYENSAAEQYDLNQVGGDLLSYRGLLQQPILAGTIQFAALGEAIDSDTPYASSDASRLTFNGVGKHIRFTAADGDGSKNIELTAPVVQYQSGDISTIRLTNDVSAGSIEHYEGNPQGVVTKAPGAILWGSTGAYLKPAGSGTNNTGWLKFVTEAA